MENQVQDLLNQTRLNWSVRTENLQTASGIIIPDTAKEKPQRGTVISVSEVDEKGNKPAVKAGDTVLYGKYAGTEISVEGKDLLIMRESDIFATI